MAILTVALGKLLDGAIGWAVGRVADVSGARLKALLDDRAARAELVEIGLDAVEAACAVAPRLAPDLRSEAYLHHVFAPALIALLTEASEGPSSEQLSQDYVDRFIVPFLRDRPLDDVLRQHFELEPGQLQAAFAALITAARPRLYASRRWRDTVTALAVEETRLGVRALQEQLQTPKTRRVDPGEARSDARIGSDGLRSWSQTIDGLHLDRPELEQLRARIRATPTGRTLLIGPAGTGKSALLAELTARLECDGMTVYAIKADQLPSDVRNLRDIADALGMTGDLVPAIETLARRGPVVLLIDQLDAVSDVMDQTSRRMQLLLQLANRWRPDGPGDTGPPVHVVVSSRPFEAQHDARFRSLRAEEMALSPPPWDAVAGLMTSLGIDPNLAPAALRETLRRPFFLKVFIEIAHRGGPTVGLREGDLLDAWLQGAPLGGRVEKQEVLELLKTLAREMTETETLWRPADRFDQDHRDAVLRAEACELLVRRDGLLGFAHQSWLDDFQARGFSSGRAVAAHAWATQDGLFGRATILRALERLRMVEPEAYGDAIDLLLGECRTRRHLRHLTVDLLATQAEPYAREINWILRLLREDAILARRVIGKVLPNWPTWRAHLMPLIATVATTGGLEYAATAMVKAEAAVDADEAERLVLQLWATPEGDELAFDVYWRAALWSPGVRAHVAAIATRKAHDPYSIADYATHLREAGRAAAAADLVGLYVQSLKVDDRAKLSLHEVGKVAEAAPGAFLAALLPWFLDLIGGDPAQALSVLDRYPHSGRLPFDWQETEDQENVFGALQLAINRCAERDASAFREIAGRMSAIERDEAQALIAEGYAAAGASLADEATAWLLADPRRFSVGVAHVQDEEGVGRTIYDYSTRELLKSITPHVPAERLAEVASAIEAWDPYTEDARAADKAADRRMWRQWAEEHRLTLLSFLPASALAPRRRRQVAENQAAEPRLRPGRGIGMASAVPSPMSAEAMSRAKDDDLFAMLDEVSDLVGDRIRRRPSRRFDGGVLQLAQAFGAYGGAHPARAIALVRERFLPGRHERAAGALVRQLGGAPSVSTAELLDLIWTLHHRGFASQSWRQDAAGAMEARAVQGTGLSDQDLALIESWIEADPAVIADGIMRRKDLDQRNRERNRSQKQPNLGPRLFGRGLGGGMFLPHGNYAYLAAVTAGALKREPADYETWLTFLERHVQRPEDPHLWAVLLTLRGANLYHADRPRVRALLEALWDTLPDSYEPSTAHTLWPCRAMLPSRIKSGMLMSWLSAPEADDRQLAGEFITADLLVSPEDPDAITLAVALAEGGDAAAGLGGLYAAAAAWRESDAAIRTAAHGLLMGAAPTARGNMAAAISTLVAHNGVLIADQRTREMLTVMVANDELLAAALSRQLIAALRGLLLHPGFGDLVLTVCEAMLDLPTPREGRRGLFVDGELVEISIALQRSSSGNRSRAMDFYEKLLDADAYGADRAAASSLQR